MQDFEAKNREIGRRLADLVESDPQRFANRLPQFYNATKWTQIAAISSAAGFRATSLVEYEVLCDFIFERWRHRGAVCFKDSSAYGRALRYSLPTRADAEELFNTMLAETVAVVSYTEIHGFGSDVDGVQPHRIRGHAKQAKEAIAVALSTLVGMDYLDHADAVELATAWLLDNPRHVFGLSS